MSFVDCICTEPLIYFVNKTKKNLVAPVVITLGLMSKLIEDSHFSLNQTFEVYCKADMKVNF